jgi:hypothetical protein
MFSRDLEAGITGLVVGIAFALVATNSLAQATGTLCRRVSDPNDAVLPDVRITLWNPGAGLAFKDSVTLSLMAAAFNGTGAPRAFQFGKRLEF